MNKRNTRAFFRLMAVVLLSFMSMLLLGCSKGKEEKAEIPFQASMSALSGLTTEEKAEKIVSQMDLGEKIGQMLIVGIHGDRLNDDSAYLLSEFHVGGVVLFDRNMVNKEQVAHLNRQLQEQAKKTGMKLPLFIALDEEGGVVSRMTDDLPAPPSQLSIGQNGVPEDAKDWAIKTAKELKAIGINVNFAPVADVGSPDSRSYSDDPEIVADFLREAASGYENEGFIYCLKHFPGLGRGEIDTHLDSGVVGASREELEQDLLPFRKMVEHGRPDNYFIMVSHLTYSAIDEKNPASISPAVISDVLRSELGYDGVVITDDMEMGAVSKYNAFGDLGVKAVQAGADIVLICHEYEHEIEIYNALLRAVESGAIPEDRINESVLRIVKTKLQYFPFKENTY